MTQSKYGFSRPPEVIQPPKTKEQLNEERNLVLMASLNREVARVGAGIKAVLHDLFDGRYPNATYTQGGGNRWYRWEATVPSYPTSSGIPQPWTTPHFHVTVGCEEEGVFYLRLDTNCLNDWYHREYPQYGWPTHRQDAELFMRVIEQVVGYPFSYIDDHEDPAVLRERNAKQSAAEQERNAAWLRSIDSTSGDKEDHTDPAWFLP